MLRSLLILTLGLCACSSSPDFRIDNPTNRALTVTIDDKTYEVPGGSDVGVTLAAGRHTLTSEATGTVNFIASSNGKGGLINPTLAQYVVVNEVYAVDNKARKGFKPWPTEIELDGVRVRGPYSLKRGLFIERAWKFGVHEPFPETIVVSSDSKGNIQGKVFTADEFVKYHTANAGDEFVEQTRTPAPLEKPVAGLPPLPDFTDAEMQAASQDMRTIYAGIAKADTKDAQEALQKSYQPATLKLLGVYSNKAMAIGPTEAQKYNDIIMTVGSALGSSVIVVN